MTRSIRTAAAILVLVPAGAWAQTQPAPPATSAPIQLSLADAVAKGLEFNVAVIVQEQARNTVSSKRLEALSALVPHVSANVRQSNQVLSTAAFGFTGFGGLPSRIGPFSTFDARIVFSAPVFDAASNAGLSAARANLRVADADYQDVRGTVTLAVANLYLQAVADAARVEASKAQVATAESLVQFATDRNAAGLIAKIDVLRQQVQLEAARAQAIRDENELAKRKLALARAIGVPANQTLELTDTVPFSAAPPIPFEAAVSDAAAHRADVQRARARLEAARADRRAVMGSTLPSVRIDGDVGAIGLTASSAERTYSVAALVHVPIFEGGRAQARLAQADAEIKQREAELADLTAGVQFDVRAALLDIRAAESGVEVALSGQSLAREELTQAQDRFRAGVASTIEVVQAQDALGRATDQYIASVYAHNVAKAELANALGDVEHRYLSFMTGRY